MIKFENVSKKFKDTKVLKDISFDIEDHHAEDDQ